MNSVSNGLLPLIFMSYALEKQSSDRLVYLVTLCSCISWAVHALHLRKFCVEGALWIETSHIGWIDRYITFKALKIRFRVFFFNLKKIILSHEGENIENNDHISVLAA